MERRATTKLFYNWSEGIFFDIRLTSQKKGGRYFEVLFVGNLGASQDLLTIVEAANILRNEPCVYGGPSQEAGDALEDGRGSCRAKIV